MSRLIVKPSLRLFVRLVLLAIRALSKKHVVTVSDIIRCIPAESVHLDFHTIVEGQKDKAEEIMHFNSLIKEKDNEL